MAMTVKELKTFCERELNEIKIAFRDFKKNDFFHLDLKVDKLAKMMYIGIGMLIITNIVIGILVQILF